MQLSDLTCGCLIMSKVGDTSADLEGLEIVVHLTADALGLGSLAGVLLSADREGTGTLS